MLETNNITLSFKDKLTLEQLCCEIIYSYYYLDEMYDNEWERRAGYVEWRINMLNYLTKASSVAVSFVLQFLKREDSTVYLEFNSLLTHYRTQQILTNTSNNTPKISIINCIKSVLAKRIKTKSKEKIVAGKGDNNE